MTVLFHGMVGFTILFVLMQIATADFLDRLRHQNFGWWFHMRRGSQFLKLLALCWTVVYSERLGWEPWPPIVFFLFAFDVHVVFQTLIMRNDIRKIEARRARSF